MNRRILVFSYAYAPLIGGAEIALHEITKRISDFEFDLITYKFDHDHPSFEVIGNVNVYRIDCLTKYLFPIAAYIKARKLDKLHRYKLLWSMMANTGFSAIFFKFLRRNIPLLLTLQEGDPFARIKKRVFFVYPIFRLIFKKADRVQAISKYLANFAKEVGFDGKVDIIPNGVDTDKFSSDVLLWPRHGGESIKLITTSRLVNKNAVDVVIRSMRNLPSEYVLNIIGDGTERKNLEKLSNSLNISNRVTFHGEIPYVELPRYLRNSDIYVRPSRSEGLGTAFIEAMAIGIPVIGTNVGGIREFLKDGVTGFVCEVDKPLSVSDKVKYIMRVENNGEILKIIENAREIVEKNYSWDLVSIKMASLMKSMT